MSPAIAAGFWAHRGGKWTAFYPRIVPGGFPCKHFGAILTFWKQCGSCGVLHHYHPPFLIKVKDAAGALGGIAMGQFGLGHIAA